MDNEISINDQNIKIGDLYLKFLGLLNFRKFTNLYISFNKRLTVIIANNGCGKTTIIDTIAIAFSPFVKKLNGIDGRKIKFDDIKKGRDEKGLASQYSMAAIGAVFEYRADKDKKKNKKCIYFLHIDGKRTSIKNELTEYADSLLKNSNDRQNLDQNELTEYSDSLLNNIDDRQNLDQNELTEYADSLLRKIDLSLEKKIPPPTLPLIVYYGTGRLWSSSKVTRGKERRASDVTLRASAYLDCFSSSSTYDFFKIWFAQVSREDQNQKLTGKPSLHHPETMLQALQNAINIIMKPVGWKDLRLNFMTNEIVMEHSEFGELPIDLLSDGVRGVLAMTADLAHRAIRLNSQFGLDACSQTPGIVLIDEIELHLHPSWQQTILDSLLEAFPKIQFIVTTHSPQVLTSVPSEYIQIIDEGGNVTTPEHQTRGVESSTVLWRVMGVDPTPQVPEAKWLLDYKALIEEGSGDSDEALELSRKLNEHFGEEHPLMEECRVLKQFVEFKRENM